MQNELDGKVVLVTGASSGIGQESARLFGTARCKVAVAARRVNRLEQTAALVRQAGGKAAVFQVDLSKSGATKELAEGVIHHFGHVDILVNNAGFGRLDWLEELDPQSDVEAQLQVNLVSAISLTRHVLPDMLTRGSGCVINIASLAGFIPTPMYSIYAASKFGLRGFTDGLRREVQSKGVSVTGIYPGFTETEFIEHIGRLSSRGARTPRWLWLSGEEVARQVVRAATKPRRAVIMPRYMHLAILFDALFPGLVDALLERFFVRMELHHPASRPDPGS